MEHCKAVFVYVTFYKSPEQESYSLYRQDVTDITHIADYTLRFIKSKSGCMRPALFGKGNVAYFCLTTRSGDILNSEPVLAPRENTSRQCQSVCTFTAPPEIPAQYLRVRAVDKLSAVDSHRLRTTTLPLTQLLNPARCGALGRTIQLADHFSRTSIPLAAAMMQTSTMPMKRPWSTTPSRAEMAAAAACASCVGHKPNCQQLGPRV